MSAVSVLEKNADSAIKTMIRPTSQPTGASPFKDLRTSGIVRAGLDWIEHPGECQETARRRRSARGVLGWRRLFCGHFDVRSTDRTADRGHPARDRQGPDHRGQRPRHRPDDPYGVARGRRSATRGEGLRRPRARPRARRGSRAQPQSGPGVRQDRARRARHCSRRRGEPARAARPAGRDHARRSAGCR